MVLGVGTFDLQRFAEKSGGLGAGGHMGLTRAFELMKEDLLRSMELLGVQNISQIQKQGENLRRESMLLSTAHLPGFVF